MNKSDALVQLQGMIFDTCDKNKQTNKQNYHKHNNHSLSGGNNKKQGNFHHQDFLIKVSKQDNE